MRGRQLTLALGMLLALAAPTLGAAQDSVKDWPCKEPSVEALTLAMVWDGAAPSGDWRADAAVQAAVAFAMNPENAPPQGAERLAALVRAAGTDLPSPERSSGFAQAGKARVAGLAATGLVDRANVLRGFARDGIRNYTLAARILTAEVAANDAALAALSKDGGPKDAGEAAERQRQGLSQARKTNFMRLDDAEDEAGHLCQRLVYIEKKLRLLLAALTAELARH